VPRIEYYFRETASGLRRNGVIAFAAMSTAFIALFLFGLAMLIGRQLGLVVDVYTGNVEVAVYLTDPVKADTVGRLQQKLQDLPAVASVDYEDKQEAYARFVDLFQNQPTVVENADPEAIPASLRVKLADTSQYDQVSAAMGCAPSAETGVVECGEPGVRRVEDHRDLLRSLTNITRGLTWGVGVVAAVMLAAAVFLVANTLRMGLFARRKEIGIMRLVGATNWRIRTPFLMEGLVESLLGGAFAVIALFVLKVVFVDPLRGQIAFVPLIRNSDILWVAPWIAIIAVAVAVVASTIGIRRFLDV
jgi:cell division transport system permease protein